MNPNNMNFFYILEQQRLGIKSQQKDIENTKKTLKKLYGFNENDAPCFMKNAWDQGEYLILRRLFDKQFELLMKQINTIFQLPKEEKINALINLLKNFETGNKPKILGKRGLEISQKIWSECEKILIQYITSDRNISSEIRLLLFFLLRHALCQDDEKTCDEILNYTTAQKPSNLESFKSIFNFFIPGKYCKIFIENIFISYPLYCIISTAVAEKKVFFFELLNKKFGTEIILKLFCKDSITKPYNLRMIASLDKILGRENLQTLLPSSIYTEHSSFRWGGILSLPCLKKNIDLFIVLQAFTDASKDDNLEEIKYLYDHIIKNSKLQFQEKQNLQIAMAIEIFLGGSLRAAEFILNEFKKEQMDILVLLGGIETSTNKIQGEILFEIFTKTNIEVIIFLWKEFNLDNEYFKEYHHHENPTLIHHALRQGLIELLEFLYDKNGNDFSQLFKIYQNKSTRNWNISINDVSLNLYHYAYHSNNKKILDFLWQGLSKDCQTFENFFCYPDLFHQLSFHGHLTSVQWLWEKVVQKKSQPADTFLIKDDSSPHLNIIRCAMNSGIPEMLQFFYEKMDRNYFRTSCNQSYPGESSIVTLIIHSTNPRLLEKFFQLMQSTDTDFFKTCDFDYYKEYAKICGNLEMSEVLSNQKNALYIKNLNEILGDFEYTQSITQTLDKIQDNFQERDKILEKLLNDCSNELKQWNQEIKIPEKLSIKSSVQDKIVHWQATLGIANNVIYC